MSGRSRSDKVASGAAWDRDERAGLGGSTAGVDADPPDTLQVSPSDRPLISGLRPTPLDGHRSSSADDGEPDWGGARRRSTSAVPSGSVARRVTRRPFRAAPVARPIARSPLPVGSLLDGRYRIVDLLGEGGMGTLLLGRNEALDVDVAIKVLRSDELDECDVGLSHRLVQEARAAARLGHPAIVRVLDFGVTEQGSPYLVMERLEGTDLGSELAARGSISPIKAVRCLLPVAHGLAAAHGKGIVHRDVKPENIFLARTDAGRVQPKLIDFGVAKIEPQRGSERVTAVGGLVGSPGYMAPEQALGEDAGPAADIWSLCVVLYEMTSGRLPFEADNYNALMRTIIERDPIPLVGHLPGELELSSIVARGLAKEPQERWPSTRALGEALAVWLLDRDVTEDVCGQALETTWLAPASHASSYDAFASLPPPSPLRPPAPAAAEGPSTSPAGAAALPTQGVVGGRMAMPPPPPSSPDERAALLVRSSLAASAAEPVGEPAPSTVPSSQHRSAPPEAPTVRPGRLASPTDDLAPSTDRSAVGATDAGPDGHGPAAEEDRGRCPAARPGRTPWAPGRLVPWLLFAVVVVALLLTALGSWLGR